MNPGVCTAAKAVGVVVWVCSGCSGRSIVRSSALQFGQRFTRRINPGPAERVLTKTIRTLHVLQFASSFGCEFFAAMMKVLSICGYRSSPSLDNSVVCLICRPSMDVIEQLRVVGPEKPLASRLTGSGVYADRFVVCKDDPAAVERPDQSFVTLPPPACLAIAASRSAFMEIIRGLLSDADGPAADHSTPCIDAATAFRTRQSQKSLSLAGNNRHSFTTRPPACRATATGNSLPK